MSDELSVKDILSGLRDEFDSKPEWFKAIAGSLPVTGQLVALHEYDKAVEAGKTGDALMAVIGGLPLVGMATKGAVLAKGAKGAAQIAERDSSVIARGLSNLGFGVGAGQATTKTAQEQLLMAKQRAAEDASETAEFNSGFSGI